MTLNLPNIRGEYRFDYDLSHLSWFKTGGKAEVFFKPEDEEDLISFLRAVDPAIPINILGNCSNIIIRDGGVKGVVIKLGKNFAKIEYEEGSNGDRFINSGAGALNSSVARFALQNSLSGLEFLIGIPGTIGGGIRMNAGSYGSEFKDVLHSFRVVDLQGAVTEIESNVDLFSYRKCSLPEGVIFLSAKFKATSDDATSIKERMTQITEMRETTQPIKEKTSGSTFANPAGHKAWKLIDEAGLRGYKIGGAAFSNLHCNFMINTGDATSKDLEDLGELAIKKVRDATGIELHWEIKRLGQ